MTGAESRTLTTGNRVFWRDDKKETGVVTQRNWAGVTIKWDNRDVQTIMHNDMTDVSKV